MFPLSKTSGKMVMTDLSWDDAPCNICKIVISSDGSGLLCDGFCRKWFHPECVGIDSKKYALITEISNTDVVSDHTKWFCKPCATKVDKLVSSVWDVDDLINLRSIVENLVSLVKGVVNDNLTVNKRLDSVNDQHNLLMQKAFPFNETKQEVVLSSATVLTSKDTDSANGKRGGPSRRSKYRSSVDVITGDTVNQSVVEIDSDSVPLYVTVADTDSNGIGEVLQVQEENGSSGIEVQDQSCLLNSDFPALTSVNSNLGSWKVVTNKKSNKRKVKVPIIGSNCDTQGKVRAVEKQDWIFISRLATDVTDSDLQKYLLDNDVKGECVELKARYSTYKSFKVGVPANLTSKLLNPTFWPKGTLVRKFTPKRDTFETRTFLGKK